MDEACERRGDSLPRFGTALTPAVAGGVGGGSFAPGKPAPDARLHLDRMQEAAVHVSPSTAQPLARFNGPDI